MAAWQLALLVWVVGIPTLVVAIMTIRSRYACWRRARRDEASGDAHVPLLRPGRIELRRTSSPTPRPEALTRRGGGRGLSGRNT